MSDTFSAYHRELSDIEKTVIRRVYPSRRRRLSLISAVMAAAIILVVLVIGGTTTAMAPLTEHRSATALIHVDVIAASITVALSAAALATERWSMACCAFASGGLTSALGLFGYWSQNTLPDPHPNVAPLFTGLWLLMFASTTLWAPLAISRPITSAGGTGPTQHVNH